MSLFLGLECFSNLANGQSLKNSSRERIKQKQKMFFEEKLISDHTLQQNIEHVDRN